jgi:hypothetical protein
MHCGRTGLPGDEHTSMGKPRRRSTWRNIFVFIGWAFDGRTLINTDQEGIAKQKHG